MAKKPEKQSVVDASATNAVTVAITDSDRQEAVAITASAAPVATAPRSRPVMVSSSNQPSLHELNTANALRQAEIEKQKATAHAEALKAVNKAFGKE